MTPQPEDAAPLPAGFGLVLDQSTRLLAGGRTMLGGSPRRLLRLPPAAAERIAAWKLGAKPTEIPELELAGRLVDAGIAHPLPPTDARIPDTTVVVPAFDRPAQLARCLDALEHELPVIIVDDGSADPGRIQALAEAAGAKLVRHADNRGPAAARNTGLTQAETEIVLFIDSDCVAQPGALERLLIHFADPRVAAVAPRIVAVPVERPGWLHRYEAARSPLDLGDHQGPVAPQTRISYVPAAALAVRVAAAEAGFSPDLRVGEDVDFIWRLNSAGWRVRYEPAAHVAHDHRTTLRGWLRRRVEYGTSAAALARRHPGRLAPVVAPAWSGAIWALVLARRLRAATAVLALTFWRVRHLLRGVGGAGAASTRLVVEGTLGTGRLAADASTRAWFPLTLAVAFASRTARAPIVAGWLLAAAIDWRGRDRRLDLPRYAATRLLDDFAYCAGVWLGCARERHIGPLLPRRTIVAVSETETRDAIGPQ